GGWRYGAGRTHPDGLARHASFAKKIAGTEHRNDGFLAGTIHDRQFHAALLDVHHGLRGIALRVDRFTSSVVHHLSGDSRGIEEGLGIESEALIGFLKFHFHFELETPLRRLGHLHINKSGFTRLFKTEQCADWNVHKIMKQNARTSDHLLRWGNHKLILE